MTHPLHHPRPRRLFLIAACIAAALLLMVGCSAADPDAEPRTGSRQPQLSTDEIVKEAIEFGQIAIPEGATVLAASTDTGIDTIYQIALRTDQDGLDRFLAVSKITAPLIKTDRVIVSIIAGPPLESSPAMFRTSDSIRRDDGKTVNRSVLVDERDVTTRYVHIRVFDT